MSELKKQVSVTANKISTYKLTKIKRGKLTVSNKEIKNLCKLLNRNILLDSHNNTIRTKPLGSGCRREMGRRILIQLNDRKKKSSLRSVTKRCDEVSSSEKPQLVHKKYLSHQPWITGDKSCYSPTDTLNSEIINSNRFPTSRKYESQTEDPSVGNCPKVASKISQNLVRETEKPSASSTCLKTKESRQKESCHKNNKEASLKTSRRPTNKQWHSSRNTSSTGMKGIPFFPLENSLQSSRHAKSSLRTNFKFDVYLNKRVVVKIVGGRWVEGTMRGYDSFMNFVLEDGVEVRKSGDRIKIGILVVRGRSMVMMEEIGLDINPAKFRHPSDYVDRNSLDISQKESKT